MKRRHKINGIKRIISLLLALAMILNVTPLDGVIDGLCGKIFAEEYAETTPILPAYVYAVDKSEFDGKTTQTFNYTSDFVDYCNYYATDDEFAADHENDVLNLVLMQDNSDEKGVLGAAYPGLGTSDHPFGGTLNVPDNGLGYFEFSLGGSALFNDVRSSVQILSTTDGSAVKLELKRTADVAGDAGKPIFANHVSAPAANQTATTWNLELTADSTNTYSGVIGEIRSNVTVNLTYENKSGANVVSNATGQTDEVADVGAVCGKMNASSVLNLSYTETTSAYSITSGNGNAGGLIGSMEGNATLNVSAMPAASSSKSVVANGTGEGSGYAGGLVGKISSAATIAFANNAQVGGSAATVFPVQGSITGANGAGGLFGYYLNLNPTNEFDLANYNVTATVYGTNCGGLFGVLENKMTGNPAQASTMTIKNTAATTLTVTSGASSDAHNYDSTGFFGGVLGKYVTDDLKNTLFLNGFSVTANASDSFAAFGGAVGYVESAAYVKADGLNVTATGTNKRSGDCDLTSHAFFGGLIGATAKATNTNANGVLVDLGNFTLKTGATGTEAYRGGGIVGTFRNGVLRLSGKTDLSAAKPYGGYSDTVNTSYGQIIGYNDNVLVYALGDGSTAEGTAAYGTGWRFVRSNGAISDDLGTWGEVVRMVSTDGSTFNNLEAAGIVTFDGTNHTVTLSAAASSIGNTVDFAKTALNAMLNQGSNYDCLLFTSGAANTRSGILASTITLTDDVDLAGTGINGFMRDGSTTISASSVGGVGTFTGTLNGGGNTITLTIGESYGIGSDGTSAASGEGSGLIYRHRYNGLFAVIGNGTTAGTVNSLTVGGTVNVHNAGPDGMSIGGIAARSHGSTTLNGVTASQTVNYYEGANAEGTGAFGKNIGGFIGFVDNSSVTSGDTTTSKNGTIEITGVSIASPAINLSGHHDTWVVYGGAIGKVASEKIAINIAPNGGDKLTVGMKADISAVTSVESNSDCGGLIGHILDRGKYSERTVNVKNLEFDGCEIGNAASSTGGGFLGYSWLNTTTTIDGLTVKGSSKINNVAGSNVATAGNVGVICYAATGKWIVDSLNISQMSMTTGAGTSLGMLVNKAYDGNNGLYLNVLNTGYVLTGSGITLPASLGVYDELAAYSADGNALLNGGNSAGVVSINMNSDRTGTEAKMTVTGTYQNQLGTASSAALGNAKYANGKTRYYYNLDVMDSSDAGQKLLLWSVNKYAASNVKNEFGTSFSNVFSGTADMTGLSFYPVATADNTTIGNMTLTFDYSGIYSIAENVFTNATTDGYVRDPGVSNQHYLMHSGLFMNLPVGKTISINGNLVLKGTFLELAGSSNSAANGYSGVLISKTMKGIVRSGDSSSIKLAGITPKTTGNVAYNSGYLLINNIVRDSTLVDRPELILKNVYTSTETGEKYPTGAIVASSLIGSASGQKLKIEFSKIRLDSRTTALPGNAGMDTAYGTTRSIFSSATLLNSIYTDQGATLEYNYTYAEDWGDGTNGERYVTYGWEVSQSAEYAGEESKYYGDKRWYTNPVNGSELGSPYNTFATGFLPYVATPYNSTKDPVTGNFQRELKVNVVSEDGLTQGCGTYNDPYVIGKNGLLEEVAYFIAEGGQGIPSINLPKNAADYDSLAENAQGNRWCQNKNDHVAYAPKNGDTTKYSATGFEDWNNDTIRLYLANAYYVIDRDLELSSSYVGLGGTQANYAFRGVIVGNENTITNKSEKPFINVSNGCVVKDLTVVVAEDGITLSQANNTYSNAYFGYASQCKYYGGIIGEIMGGDNIIDNSYVKFSYQDADDNSQTTQITLSGANGTIVPVGGYVGVVVYGGLIFKNMTKEKTAVSSTHLSVKYVNGNTSTTNGVNLAEEKITVNNQETKNEEAWAAIYVNPIVGRVINGYAINETETNATKGTTGRFSVTEENKYHDEAGTPRSGNAHSLKNGTKHYAIADVNKSDDDKLDVTAIATSVAEGNIDVPNAQALFILSLITQSCAGTATENGGDYVNSLSYGINGGVVYGMSHNADYSDVGTNDALVSDDPATENVDETNVTDYQKLASSDTAENQAVPYIIRHYTKIEEKTVRHYEDNGWTISFDDSGTTKYLKIDGDKLLIQTTPYYFTSITKENGKWKIQGENGGYPYVQCKWTSGFAAGASWDAGAKLDLYNSDGTQYTAESINGNSFYLSNQRGGSGAEGQRYYFEGTKLSGRWVRSTTLISEARPVTFNHYVTDYLETSLAVFARCVTSTKGYYNINLTGSGTYQLPDSYRGLGCAGIYDSASGTANKFSIKLNVFDGKGCTIDQDIYINKNYSDCYFNTLHNGTNQTLDGDNNKLKYDLDHSTQAHGIGLFNSVIMKASTGKFYNFTLKGSVRTAIFSNSYLKSSQQFKGTTTSANDTVEWLATGGVCGWSQGNQDVNFVGITLNGLILSGSNHVAGLLAFSGNSSSTHNITVTDCNANDIDYTMTASQFNARPRNAMGAFVGNVRQGKVIVYGTMAGAANGDLDDFSTVTIKSFAFGDESKAYNVSVGGLVGFSGHGFEAYDMRVSSSAGTVATIGYALAGTAGGIVGVMQPYAIDSIEGYGKFVNCMVSDIDVCGNYAGGIYGGKWGGNNAYVPYRIEFKNCEVISNDSRRTITGGESAGGLVGNALVYTRTNNDPSNLIIGDCKVINYNIVSNANQFSGGFIGYCDSMQQSITCYIHDSSVEDCVIGQPGTTDYAGGAIGGIAKKADNKILGYNIKLDNVTSPSDRMGAWVGWMDGNDSATTIQFTGMAIYGVGYEKNIGNWSVEKNQANTKTSFVFADYMGKSELMDEQNATLSGLNYDASTHVDMPKYPYVNVNPQASLGGSVIISSDGAVSYGTSISGSGFGTADKTMAAKIFADISDTSNTRRYTTFGAFNGTDDAKISGDNKIEYYMQRQVTDDGDRISTFKTERGSKWISSIDFPVVVIANTEDEETTNLINRYIQLVTNTTTNYASDDATNAYYDIVVKTCKYVDSSTGFAIVTDTSGLGYADGVFSLNGAFADSNKDNTFTLVDVQFKDPLDTTKIAYHLYVPVYTIKQMTYNFYTTALTGTDSVKYNANEAVVASEYEDLLDDGGTHIDSLKTWITQYVRFEYEMEDINLLIDAGNLDWNFNKTMTYATQPNSFKLPDQTFMILVDPNGDADKVYSASASSFAPINTGYGGWRIDLDHFTNSSNLLFVAQPFKNILARSLMRDDNAGAGKYEEVTASDPYTLCYMDGNVKKYYQYVEDGTGDYDFRVTEDFHEDYYISFWVPEPQGYSNELFYYSVVPANTISGTRTAKINQFKNYNMLIANLYLQDTTTKYSVEPDDQLITGTNNTLHVDAATTIRITNPNAKQYLAGSNLYHAFKIVINKYESGGQGKPTVEGIAEGGLTAQFGYTTDAYANQVPSTTVQGIEKGTDYLLVPTTDIMSALLACSNDQAVTVYARVNIDYNDASTELAKAFPERGAGEDSVGTNVSASSNLAYESNRLAYTSMTAPFEEDWHYYYLESINKALLNYYVTDDLDEYDKVGKESGNRSRLGINGKATTQSTMMPINTKALYNVGVLDNYATGDVIRLTITMKKKTDESSGGTVSKVEYKDIATIANYATFGASAIKSGNQVFVYKPELSTPGKLVYEAASANCHFDKGYYHFDVAFSVKTGAGFKEYANYRVVLQAELINTTLQKTVENSLVSDYVVYTNAKVYTDVINRGAVQGN